MKELFEYVCQTPTHVISRLTIDMTDASLCNYTGDTPSCLKFPDMHALIRKFFPFSRAT